MTEEHQWQQERQQFIAESQHRGAAASLGESPGSLMAQQFATLAQTLFTTDTVGHILTRVLEVAQEVIPGVELASITLCDENGQFHTPAHTHETACALDELQYTHQEGPCVQAALRPGSGLVHSPDLAQDAQWPTWGPQAAERGVSSVLSAGLFPAGQSPRRGALNCYSTQPHGLAKADEHLVLLLASHAAIAVAATTKLTHAELEIEQLHRALETRDVIGQAKGILMQRQNLTAEQAFDLLRSTSQNLNAKLVDIARTLTSRRSEL